MSTFKIGYQTSLSTPMKANEKWFKEGVKIITSDHKEGAKVIVDFSYSVPTIVEYTLDGRDTWIKFNGGTELIGEQSKKIRVISGSSINFRAKKSGTLHRCIIGEE